jgi:hypothetical protein
MAMTSPKRRSSMNREDNEQDVVDLGAVTEETKGGAIGFVDSERTLQPSLGLSDD